MKNFIQYLLILSLSFFFPSHHSLACDPEDVPASIPHRLNNDNFWTGVGVGVGTAVAAGGMYLFYRYWTQQPPENTQHFHGSAVTSPPPSDAEPSSPTLNQKNSVSPPQKPDPISLLSSKNFPEREASPITSSNVDLAPSPSQSLVQPNGVIPQEEEKPAAEQSNQDILQEADTPEAENNSANLPPADLSNLDGLFPDDDSTSGSSFSSTASTPAPTPPATPTKEKKKTQLFQDDKSKKRIQEYLKGLDN